MIILAATRSHNLIPIPNKKVNNFYIKLFNYNILCNPKITISIEN